MQRLHRTYNRVSVKMRFSDRCGFLQLTFILSALLNTSYGENVNPSLYTISAPLTVNVQQGLCVYVPCKYTVQQSLSGSAGFFWFRGDDSGPVFTSQDKSLTPESNKERIFFTGDSRKYDCSISINDAQSSDAGEYLFRINDGPRSWSYQNYKITLNVIELTERPVITSQKTFVAGETVTLTCESPGRCAGPAPIITWSSKIKAENVAFNTNYPDGNRTFHSNITFSPSKEDNQTPLTCTVSFKSSSTTTSKQITLNVEYLPIVSVLVQGVVQNEGKTVTVMEGSSKMLACTVDSNPKANIIWYHGEKSLSENPNGSELTYNLINASPTNIGIYQCLAKNNRGTTNRSIRINVEYVPRTPRISCFMDGGCTIDGTNTSYAKEGSSFILLCSVESSPASTVMWKKPGDPNYQPPNSQISLSNIVIDNEGLYTCQAINSHGTSSASIKVRVTYEPRSVPGLNSTCKELGSHIECVCIIQTFPEATIQWKIDEKYYSSSDNGLRISTTILRSVTNSSMTLQLTQRTVSHIECISSNKYGDLVLILLDKKSNYIFLMVVAIAVFITAVILGVGVILLLYFRKRKLKRECRETKVITVTNSEEIYSNAHIYSGVQLFRYNFFSSSLETKISCIPISIDVLDLNTSRTYMTIPSQSAITLMKRSLAMKRSLFMQTYNSS